MGRWTKKIREEACEIDEVNEGNEACDVDEVNWVHAVAAAAEHASSEKDKSAAAAAGPVTACPRTQTLGGADFAADPKPDDENEHNNQINEEK
jgi:hypothetical protein